MQGGRQGRGGKAGGAADAPKRYCQDVATPVIPFSSGSFINRSALANPGTPPGPHHGPDLHSALLKDPGHRSYSVPETASTPGRALVFGHGLLKLPGSLPGQGELEGGRNLV